MKKLGIIICVLVLATAARSDGIYNPPANGIGGGNGIFNFGVSSAPPSPCDNELDFTDACNSQYIGLL